jgi:predicted PolB exonuclease-like 3'-5' exonuclease
MARIDIKTLVLAFERRITEIEKNPPDKVPMTVIFNLLEKAIDEALREYFHTMILEDLKIYVEDAYKEKYEEFIETCLDNILEDDELRKTIEHRIKTNILNSIK